jgi:uncharacterized phage protein (TIGR01671 family)
MRDIEFRGKRTDNGEWVYGYYAHLHKTTYCFKEDYDAHPENELHRMIFEHEQDWGLPNYHLQVDVDPKTVGQYTGLKDKNGTKIFDGDIVLVPYIDPIFKCTWNDTSPCERAIVKHCNGMFYVEYIESGDKFTLSAMDGYMKIIGNIYDNPELLEGDNNG